MVFVVLGTLSANVLASGILTADTLAFDAGQVLEGQIVIHTYLLANSGDAVLTITNVSSSCGCTTTSLAKNVLAPGESVPLEARFNSGSFGGQTVTKVIHIDYTSHTDPAKRRLDLTLAVTVLRPGVYDLMTGDLDEVFFLLVDLRSPDAYASRHLIGALNIPYEKLGDWIGVLPRGVFTVLYDQDGTLALSAAQSLRAAGYPDAQSLRGGLDAWAKAYGSRFAAEEAPLRERFLLPAEPPATGTSAVQAPIDVSYLQSEFVVLIDLRSPEAYATAHFAGAVNVHPADLSAWVARLPASARIVLYDDDGSIARPLATALVEANYKNAQALFGGLAEWRAAFGEKLLVTLVQ
jgi:rhodanese-related sulfurtransferase